MENLIVQGFFTLRVLQYNDAPKIYVDDNSSIHSIDITVDEDFNDENDSIWIFTSSFGL